MKKKQKTRKQQDEINDPSHYGGKDNPLEVIKVLREYMTRDEFIGFLNGNVLKYSIRWRKKGGEKDLKKANYYSNYLDSYLEETPVKVQ